MTQKVRLTFTRKRLETATIELDVTEDVAAALLNQETPDDRMDIWARHTVVPRIPATAWERLSPTDYSWTAEPVSPANSLP